MRRLTILSLTALAGLASAGPALAEVRYQGNLVANGTQFVTFDFKTRKPILKPTTLDAAAAKCVVSGAACQSVTIHTNDSDPAGNQVATLAIAYAGGSGSGIFAPGAFSAFGVSRVLDSETLTGTVTVTELGDDAAPVPPSDSPLTRNIVFGILGLVALGLAVHFGLERYWRWKLSR